MQELLNIEFFPIENSIKSNLKFLGKLGQAARKPLMKKISCR
jgi:hypothetical protein